MDASFSMTEEKECMPLSGTKRSILEGKIGGAKVVAGVWMFFNWVDVALKILEGE